MEEPKEIRVYIAGPLSGSTLKYLENMRRMMSLGTRLFIMGFAPFCPCLDYQYNLMRPELEEPLTIEMFYGVNIAWVSVCDAVLVLPGWENSKGTKAEIERAVKKNIPVFHHPGIFLAYFGFPPDPTLEVLYEQWEAES